MKKIENWNDVQAMKNSRELPVDAYVCKILTAKVKEYTKKDGTKFERLEVAIDIDEGEYAGYYKEEFNGQTWEDKKWKGVLRLYVPSDDGSEGDEHTKRRLKSFVQAVEDSNIGYHWDWDETKLKGKKVGVVFRFEEWEYNGKTGWKTRPFYAITVADARDGKFKMPKRKALDGRMIDESKATTPSISQENSNDSVDFDLIFDM